MQFQKRLEQLTEKAREERTKAPFFCQGSREDLFLQKLFALVLSDVQASLAYFRECDLEVYRYILSRIGVSIGVKSSVRGAKKALWSGLLEIENTRNAEDADHGRNAAYLQVLLSGSRRKSPVTVRLLHEMTQQYILYKKAPPETDVGEWGYAVLEPELKKDKALTLAFLASIDREEFVALAPFFEDTVRKFRDAALLDLLEKLYSLYYGENRDTEFYRFYLFGLREQIG